MARRVWRLVEPYHAVVYFAPEAKPRYEAAGLKGGWMGYFASRSAALGPVPAEIVIATFYNFHPRMVRRAIPDAWSRSTPDRVLAARYAIADAGLRRTLGDAIGSPELAEAAALGREAAQSGDPAGRPLFAAHAALEWPDEPHLVLWHACTLLREFRGDGHVASLLATGIDGCEAHVTLAATRAVPGEILRANRGWTEEEWSAAEERLRARGWLDKTGAHTAAGRRARRDVETRTDRLALPPYEALGEERGERFADLMTQLSGRILDGPAVPFPNPMGLDRPRPRQA